MKMLRRFHDHGVEVAQTYAKLGEEVGVKDLRTHAIDDNMQAIGGDQRGRAHGLAPRTETDRGFLEDALDPHGQIDRVARERTDLTADAGAKSRPRRPPGTTARRQGPRTPRE